MEQKYESVLRFNKYIVNKVSFKNNDNFKQSSERMSMEFNIQKDISKKNNNMEVTLSAQIFNDAEKNNYPFEMEVVLTGYFTEINNDTNVDFEPNAIAILYPYIRAIVSTYTAAANISPLILPAINVNKLLEEQDD